MPANIPHRIDSAQPAVPVAMGRVRVRNAVKAGSGAENCVQSEQIDNPLQQRASDFEAREDSFADSDPDIWLRAHANDLIGHLQNWSNSLDRREAGLNARIAMHESRERQFRLRRSELADQLAEGQARVDQLRQQLEARARRLAFENHF